MQVRVFGSLIALGAICGGLSGCMATVDNTAPVDVPAAGMAGAVHGGQQPVAGSTVQVISVGTSGYGSAGTVLSTATTTAGGNFAMPAYTCPQANTPVYIVAHGGNPGMAAGTNNTGLTLMSVLGRCDGAQQQFVQINEVTTVAAAYALAQFSHTVVNGLPTFGGPSTTTNGVITYPVGLVNAMQSTAPTLASTASGTAGGAASGVTVPIAKINTLANILATCVNSSGSTSLCQNLFTATRSGTTTIDNTLSAALSMALHSSSNVGTLFGMTPPAPPFPGLSVQPADLTLSVSYPAPAGSTGVADGDTFSNLAIDAQGNVWVPNGLTGILQFVPSAGQYAGPFNNASGVQRAEQVAVDMSGRVWVAGHGAAALNYTSTAAPLQLTAVGAFAQNLSGTTVQGSALTLGIGPAGELRYGATLSGIGYAVVSRAAASSNNIELSALQGAPFSQNSNASDTGFLTKVSNTAYPEFYSQSSAAHRVQSGFASLKPGQLAQAGTGDTLYPLEDTSQLCHYDGSCSQAGLNGPRGLATDGSGQVWVANAGNASLSSITPGVATQTTDPLDPFDPGPSTTAGQNDLLAGTYTLGTAAMPGPSGVAIDQSGNVWISNPYVTQNVLTEVIGVAAPTIQPQAAQYQSATGFLVGTKPTH